jgi:flavin reductase (DIM6/NTAB) family NADH-FMN oxidoreductase RutF
MPIDTRTFRQTVGQFATGVTVIALDVEGTTRAMTANSFTSLSLDPPLVLFCVGKRSKAGQRVHASSGFSINILAEGQRDISTYFAGAWKGGPPPPFSFMEWKGGPRLEGSVAALGCEVEAIHEGGDHWIVVGRVLALHRAEPARRPLVYYQGAYAALGEERDLISAAPSFQGIGW